MLSHQWQFDHEATHYTPSVMEGIPYEQELVDRTKGCHFLVAVAAKLNLPQLVVITAATFFHRFYMRQSMKRYHVYDIAATCLFVASKVEESPRRIKDFVHACAQKALKRDKLMLSEDSKDFNRWRDTMLNHEVILLETLCFDLTLEHPQMYLLNMQSECEVPDSCIHKAWILLFQSLGSPLCVQYHPQVIAAAALLLAYHLSSEEVPPPEWWMNFDVDPGQIHELAAEMLSYDIDHYANKPGSLSSQQSSSSSVH